MNKKSRNICPESVAVLSLLLSLLLFNIQSAAVTSGRLVYSNGTTATLSYDTATGTYVDTSLSNPNIYVEICADLGTDLIGNFTSLYYRSGDIYIDIGLVPANITSVNASNCTIVDVDTSVYKSFYPGIVSIGISHSPSMSSPIFIDLNETTGLLSGSYKYTDASNTTNTIIRLAKVYYTEPNEILTDKPYLIVSLWNASGFINSTLINRTADAVFPLTSYTIVKVNNLTAGVYVPPSGCLTDADCAADAQCIGGVCVPKSHSEPEPTKLSVSVDTSGYVGDPVKFTVTNDRAERGASVKIYRVEGGFAVLVDSGTTDEDGVYVADPAALDKEGEYFARASKSGNYYHSDDTYFTLQKRSLSLSVQQEAYIRTALVASVYDTESGRSIEGATAKLYAPSGSVADTCTTNADGRCAFSTTATRIPGRYVLTASKQFYNDAAASLTILLYPLDVDYPGSVYARQPFDIKATSFGRPVQGVIIRMNNQPQKTTDSEGKAGDYVFKEPGEYSFTATKDDYVPFSGKISVSYPPLIPVYPNETYSKETFILSVTSPDKDCISNVSVDIGGLNFTTNAFGETQVRVEVPNNYTVVLSKEGCEEYRGVREIPERPPEAPYEKPIIVEKPPKSGAELLSEEIGLGTLVKSGCEGFYIEGIPLILCDLMWVVVFLFAGSAAYLGKDNLRKVLYFFVPLITALATIPLLGVFVGAILLSTAYRAWAAERSKMRALKEEAEKIQKQVAEGKSVEEALKEGLNKDKTQGSIGINSAGKNDKESQGTKSNTENQGATGTSNTQSQSSQSPPPASQNSKNGNNKGNQ